MFIVRNFGTSKVPNTISTPRSEQYGRVNASSYSHRTVNLKIFIFWREFINPYLYLYIFSGTIYMYFFCLDIFPVGFYHRSYFYLFILGGIYNFPFIWLTTIPQSITVSSKTCTLNCILSLRIWSDIYITLSCLN